MNTSPDRWLLLVASLPTSSATARMRLWRAVKALGCAPLRDGAYLLPFSDDNERQLRTLMEDTVHESGQAWLLEVADRSGSDVHAFRAQFDRSAEFAQFDESVAAARKALAAQSPAEIARAVRRLRREFESLQRIDFFPGDAGVRAQSRWADFVAASSLALSPGEPQGEERAIVRRDPAEFRARRWATRRRLWVDRVASAWLIRRFIDRDAQFVWLDSPADCPRDAIGFDFDGATFSHVGNLVTFEVLVASFGLDADRALARIAAIVHALDSGGAPAPEAGGFEAILAGARRRLDDDHALLDEMGSVLDSLYSHFGDEGAT